MCYLRKRVDIRDLPAAAAPSEQMIALSLFIHLVTPGCLESNEEHKNTEKNAQKQGEHRRGFRLDARFVGGESLGRKLSKKTQSNESGVHGDPSV